MSDEAIFIEKYNNNWPKMFSNEKASLALLLKNHFKGTIEHVGSTAVKGLAAKPIIDIMIGVESLETSKHLIETLTQSGYCYYPYKSDVMHWFCKPSAEIRTHHLHLIPYLSPLWNERIKFRNALRVNPELANQYQELKYQLAEEFTHDREGYTKNKWPFIKKVIKKSLNK